MNSFERVIGAVNFQKIDKIPVFPQIFGHAAILNGIPLDQYIQNGELIADCQLNALKKYGHDAVFTVIDVNVETEALGSELLYRKNQYAVINKYALSDKNNIDKLKVPDPENSGRMPEMLKAIKILRSKLKNDIIINGCVLGPMTLATQLLGIENALYMIIDEKNRFEKILDFTCDVLIRFGIAQISAGAHLPIVFDPSASPAVIPHKLFRDLEAPRLKRLFSSLKDAGAIANWLHIAGPTESIMTYYDEIGVNIANFDYCVKPQDAIDKLPGICLDGNIKSLSFIESKPDEIQLQACQLIEAFDKRGGFILSSGCEIPPESRADNIYAMVNYN